MDDLSDKQDLFILFFFYQMLLIDEQNQFGSIWDEFEQGIIFKNRFFSDSPVVHEIERFAESSTKNYNAGELFFRARVYKEDPMDRFSAYYVKKYGGTKAQFEEQFRKMSPMEMQTLVYSTFGLDMPDDSSEFLKELLDVRDERMKHVRFKGYNAKESTAPPAEKTTEGRVNPAYIRYLYVCEDEETTKYEISPNLSDLVSIATFRLKRDAKVFDLTAKLTLEEWEPKLLHLIQIMFSKPNKSNPEKYKATQFIAEKIKNMGFDGIRYNSSLHNGGINVAFFHPDICKAISSKIVSISDINISSLDYPL